MTSTYLDQDGQQEYELARLEGCDHAAAMLRGRSANNEVSARRQLNRAHVSRFEHVTEDGIVEEQTTGYNYMQDHRSDTEREAQWSKADVVTDFLQICTEHQRKVLDLRFGLTTGEPLSNRQVAKVLGVAPQSVDKAIGHVRRKAAKYVTNVTDKEVAFSV